MEVSRVLIGVAVMAFVILACRAAPFLFALGNGRFSDFVSRLVPPVAMTALAVCALASAPWRDFPHGIPELAASACVVVIHALRRNALLSIAGGTAAFMLLKAMLAG